MRPRGHLTGRKYYKRGSSGPPRILCRPRNPMGSAPSIHGSQVGLFVCAPRWHPSRSGAAALSNRVGGDATAFTPRTRAPGSWRSGPAAPNFIPSVAKGRARGNKVAGVHGPGQPGHTRHVGRRCCLSAAKRSARRDGPVAAKCRPEWSCDSLACRWGFGHARNEIPLGAAGAHGLHTPRFRSARVHNAVWATNGSVLAYLTCRAVSNPTAVCTGPSTSFTLDALLLHPIH